jgi:hypothetical protein
MRSLWISLPLAVIVAGTAGTATADVQLSADAPARGLPAVAKDGSGYARPVKVQPSGCKGVQTFVQVGAVGGPSHEPSSELVMVADECGAGGKVAAGIGQVNDLLREGKYQSVGTLAAQPLPAEMSTAHGTVKVVGAGKHKITVSVSGSTADRWTVTLDGEVIEVRGWYASKSASGAAYVALLVATSAADTGARGRERWVDVWPIGAPAAADHSPVDVATRWMTALKAKDAKAVARLSSTPFWKVGLKPVSGTLAKKCKRLDAAKTQGKLGDLARCMTAASELYTRLDDRNALAEIDLRDFPAELRKHKKAVQKLVRGGHKLVRYHVNDDSYYVFLIFVLDPDTDHQTVLAVLESIDVED